MTKRPVRLAGGDGWPSYLAGTAKPGARGGQSRVLSLPPDEIVYFLDRRIQQMASAVEAGDVWAAKAPLEESMVMLTMTSHLPGDAERRAALRTLVTAMLNAEPETH